MHYSSLDHISLSLSLSNKLSREKFKPPNDPSFSFSTFESTRTNPSSTEMHRNGLVSRWIGQQSYFLNVLSSHLPSKLSVVSSVLEILKRVLIVECKIENTKGALFGGLEYYLNDRKFLHLSSKIMSRFFPPDCRYDFRPAITCSRCTKWPLCII